MSRPTQSIRYSSNKVSRTQSPYPRRKRMSQVPLIDVDPRVRRELPRPVDFHSRGVIGRRATRRNHFVTLAFALVLLSCPCLAADTPGASLTKSFQAAKAALAAQDMVHGEQH